MVNKAGDKSYINSALCAGEVCDVCGQVCKQGAIKPIAE